MVSTRTEKNIISEEDRTHNYSQCLHSIFKITKLIKYTYLFQFLIFDR
jgi:hypothetical protein